VLQAVELIARFELATSSLPRKAKALILQGFAGAEINN